ncbi:hypothetical protein CR513_42491, partial [Mucuna pruriens]
MSLQSLALESTLRRSSSSPSLCNPLFTRSAKTMQGSLRVSPLVWRGKKLPCLGLKLTHASFVAGVSSQDAPNSPNQGNQSFDRSVLEADSSAQGDGSSTFGSSSSECYPFEIRYRDNSGDDLLEGNRPWVEPEVKNISSELSRPSSLLGMAAAICQRGPWSVNVIPCRSDESVDGQPAPGELDHFYLYDTLPLKLGVKLPFTHFERLVLQVLNVAPTQLHSNSWAFVRSFELLCEDLGWAPSLGVFFWFFSLRKAKKVGWTSLSGRPNCKLFKPFLESYKAFKSRFFKVTRGDAGPNLLRDNSGKPFFPLHWTPQLAVSVTVSWTEVEDWEKEFIKELSQFPVLPSAHIIKGRGYSAKHLKNIKKRMSQTAESEVGVSAVPLSATDPEAQQALVESARVPLVVLLDSSAISSQPTETSSVPGGKRAVVDQLFDRPGKRATLSKADHDREPSLLSWTPPNPLHEVIDRSLTTSADKSTVEGLGVSGTFGVLQQYAGYSMVLARAAKVEFASIEKRNHSLANRLSLVNEENVKLITAYSEAEAKINNYRDAIACLQEDLQGTITKNKDLLLAKSDLETAKDYLSAQLEVLKQENEMQKAALSNLGEKLSVAESNLIQVTEAKDQIIQSKDQTLSEQERAILEQYECGFGCALEQIKLLYPDLDVSEVDPFKEIVDGQLVSIPTSPDSPAS